jgi:hypothetical protein
MRHVRALLWAIGGAFLTAAGCGSGGGEEGLLEDVCRGLNTCNCPAGKYCAAVCTDAGTCDVACANSAACYASCIQDDDCRVDCKSSGDCSGRCQGATSCLFDCTGADRCDVACEGAVTCSVLCQDATSCEVDCAGGKCNVGCPATGCVVKGCDFPSPCAVSCGEALRGDGHGGLELRGEHRHPELLDQPAEGLDVLLGDAAGDEIVALLEPVSPEGEHLIGLRLVLLRAVRQALQPDVDGAQVPRQAR